MAMTAPQLSADPMTAGFFALDRNNTWVHVYPDVPSMLAVNHVGAGADADFFDTRGRRFEAVFNNAGRLESLKETADPTNVPIVQMRLRTVMTFLFNALPQRLHDDPDADRKLKEGRDAIPALDGLSLPDCHAALSTVFGDRGGPGAVHPENDGSFWHNFWCH
jgi:hypothetical protein